MRGKLELSGGSSRDVLVISYYFPPMGMGGVQRAVKFVKYLPRLNWRPIVLASRGEEYHAHDPSLLADIPKEAVVIRIPGPGLLLTKLKRSSKGGISSKGGRSLALWRWLEDWLLIPDGKIFWSCWALIRGLRLLRREPVRAIFTTSPPHSIHLVGYLLKKTVGVPWVADFRDAWTEGHFERHRTGAHRALKEICEREALKTADRVIGVTTIITERLSRRVPRSSKKFITITNGYDEDDFAAPSPYAESNREFVILYCGTLSTLADPTAFLRALGEIKKERPELNMRFVWVGKSLNFDIPQLVDRHDLAGWVDFRGYLNHQESVRQMCRADLLLLLISPVPGCEMIMTGKIFEYLRAGRPILALIPEGAAAEVIRATGSGTIVPPDSPHKIKEALLSLYDRARQTTSFGVGIQRYDRCRLTKRLARIFEEIASRPGEK